jgi:hypothetical protein
MWIPLLLCGFAQAGSLFVHAEVAADLRRGDELLLSTFGPTEVWLSNLPEGPHLITVMRGTQPEAVELTLPKDGDLRLSITSTGSKVEPQPPRSAQEPNTWLHVDPAPGQRFALVVDGRRIGVLGPQQGLSLRGLPPGPHPIELRSPSLTTIWARGTLLLEAGQPAHLIATEGRPMQVKGARLAAPDEG